MTPSWLELKIPPPLIAGMCAGVYSLMTSWIPSMSVSLPLFFSLLCVILAVFFGVGGVIGCWRQKTTIHPWSPEETAFLVTTGVFAVSRNPMYLALLLLLSGWVVQPLHPASLLALVIFIWYLNRFQIIPEERVLADKFGALYATYCAQVRRWI